MRLGTIGAKERPPAPLVADEGIAKTRTVPKAATHQPALPRAALLQRLTPYDKRNIAGFLTFTEATSMMLTSKDMNRAIQADPLLRLDEISPAFAQLGCNQLRGRIQKAEAQISALRLSCPQPAADLQPVAESKNAAESASSEPASGTRVSQLFKQGRARAAHALQWKERAKQADAEKRLHEAEAHAAQLTAQLNALEPEVEGIVFHFAADRMKGPRPLGATRSTVQTIAPNDDYGRLHKAMKNGEFEMVRAVMREFLSLPSHLVPNAKKVAWLHGPLATSTLKSIAQRYCGFLDDEELKTFGAVRTYIDEVVSSPYLTSSDKELICESFVLEEVRSVGKEGPAPVPSVRNGPVSACVLLGIYESSADVVLKHALLESLAKPWPRGIGGCVDSIGASVALYRHRAPQWVDQVIVRLERIGNGPCKAP